MSAVLADARFAPPRTGVETRADGTLLYRSLHPLPSGPERVTDWLAHWAAAAPDRSFLTERAGPRRVALTYAEAWRDARDLAVGLLAAGHGPDRPLAILAPNGIAHARVAFAALLAGIPCAPLPPSIAAEGFLSRLDAMFSAGASLPTETGERLRALARRAGRDVPVLSGRGATETGPGATLVHAAGADPACIGTPLPGTVIKLVPVSGKTELLVRSPSVARGYWQDPDRTRDAFDGEGFYRTGDAGRILDPARPDRGLAFDGRIVEDFKLATGTWVSAGPLRLALLRATRPLLRDLVLTGADRDVPCALAWPDPTALGLPPEALPAAARHEGLRRDLRAALRRHNAAQNGSSTRIARLLLLDRPPSAADGEINEKGTVNPRAVLAARPSALAALHAPRPGPDVLVPGGQEEPSR